MGRLVTAMILSGAALGAGVGFAYGATGPDPEPGVTPHELWLFLHLLLFVFWFGADVGVLLSARAVAAPGRTVADRLNAAWLMSAIELAPRVSASLMLTVGGILTEYVGIAHPPWQMAGLVLLGPGWLTLVLVGYFRRGTRLGAAADRLDFWCRCLLVPAIIVSVTYSWLTNRLADAPYVAGKLLLFAALVFLGLLVRIRMGPFVAGLGELARAGESATVEASMARSLARAQPLVVLIWLGLALAALLGVAKPGAPLNAASAPAAAVASLH